MRHTVLVLNSKGGCGKTTLAINLASYYACHGLQTALVDYDPQGSAMTWHRIRHATQAPIHAIAAYRESRTAGLTRTWQLSPPPATERVIIDAPAGVHGHQLEDFTRRVDTILIPVLPSSIDMSAASDFIRDLLLMGKARVHQTRLGVVANRVRQRTQACRTLRIFLQTLNIPFVASLRDTQNYVHAAEQGRGIHELTPSAVSRDVDQWTPLITWLERGVACAIGNTGSDLR